MNIILDKGTTRYRMVFLTGVTQGETEFIQIRLEQKVTLDGGAKPVPDWQEFDSFFVTKDFLKGLAEME